MKRIVLLIFTILTLIKCDNSNTVDKNIGNDRTTEKRSSIHHEKSILTSHRSENVVDIPLAHSNEILRLLLPNFYDTIFQWVKYSDYGCQNFHVTTISDTKIQSYFPDTVSTFVKIDSSDFARKNISIYQEKNLSCNKKSIEEWKNYLNMVYGKIKFEWLEFDDHIYAVGYYNYRLNNYLLNIRVIYIINNENTFYVKIEDSNNDSIPFKHETNKIIESIQVLNKN